jgi:hypothetical protein
VPFSLFSPTGPEVPPDAAATRSALEEPTQRMLIIAGPPAKATARTVLVYEQTPRRPWRLWAFAGLLVALTIGVVLGQAEAFQPFSRGPSAQAAVVPSPVTAPLAGAGAGARVFELTGDATTARIVTADLGDLLYSIAPTDPAAAWVTTRPDGAGLRLAHSGAEIRLNRAMAWTVRVDAASADLEIDTRVGDMAGLSIAGATARASLQLPAPPRATTKITVTAPVTSLSLTTTPSTPVRVRLHAGAGAAVTGGKTRTGVKPGVTLTPTAWQKAKLRYDVTATAAIGSLRIG